MTETVPCFYCQTNAGDIFLCGEGLICTECMSELSGEEESKLFDEESVTDEVRSKTRQRLQESRIDGN